MDGRMANDRKDEHGLVVNTFVRTYRYLRLVPGY